MDKVLSFVISAGIVAFGIWIVVGESLAGAAFGWSLMGLLPIFVGATSLYDTAQGA
jgi:hypothetical protein